MEEDAGGVAAGALGLAAGSWRLDQQRGAMRARLSVSARNSATPRSKAMAFFCTQPR